MLACLLCCALRVAGGDVADAPPIDVRGFSGVRAETASGPLAPGVRSERWWKRDEHGITERIAELRLERPVTPAAWLARWRSAHGCSAAVTRRIAPLAGLRAPQLTFSGACKGGDLYVIHLVQLPGLMVELHVDTTVLGTPPAQLDEAMRRLLARARPTAIETPASR